MGTNIKSFLPRGLFGRAALILIVPVVAIQLIVSVVFIQRHYDGITRQMTRILLGDLAYVLAELDRPAEGGTAPGARDRALEAAFRIDIERLEATTGTAGDSLGRFDLSGRAMAEVLHEGLPELAAIDLTSQARRVVLRLDRAAGPLEISFARSRVSAQNPHQLLAIMGLASILMTGVAYVFLRNQLTPIANLAEAAEAFGRGETLPLRPRGATEVRAAANAFLAMRARIERQIESRTLMLSGVSHDLRTPLTRLKLGLSFLPEDEETEALKRDVAEMERLVEAFLSFARGDATEEVRAVDVMALAQDLIARRGPGRAAGAGREIALAGSTTRKVRLRPDAIGRALGNLLDNALRHGRAVRLTLRDSGHALAFVVEDDGPGIAADLRDRAVEPFQRLDDARDPNLGGGVGLGLSIAADIARSHGGSLRLGESEDMGGLKAELILPG